MPARPHAAARPETTPLRDAAPLRDPAAPASTALVPRAPASPIERAGAWANLPEDELRRRAVAACQARDLETLWSLTEAFMVLKGRAGAAVSRSTRDNYRRALRALLAGWTGENLLHPRRDAAMLWVRRMEADGARQATVTIRVAAARWLYQALRWARATDADPFVAVRPATDPTPAWEKRAPFTPAELEALLRAADTEVDQALVLLAGHAGLRACEIVGLCWPEVDLAARTLTVRAGKGRKQRTVRLSARLAAALSALRPADGAGAVLPYRSRVTAWRRLRAVAARAGVTARGVHALRHTAGTRLYRERRDLALVAAHLGHAGLDTARIYAKMGGEELREAVEDW